MTLLSALLEVTIYSWILFLIIIILKKALKDKSSARFQYLIWFLLIARLCIPITFDTDIRLFVIPETNVSPNQDTYIKEQMDKPTYIQDSILQDRLLKNSQTMPQTNASQIGIDLTVLEPINTKHISTAKPTIKFTWQQIVIVIWLIGAISILSFFAVMTYQINKKIQSSRNIPPKSFMSMVDGCREDLSIKKPITPYLVDDIITPALTVSLRPKLLLPTYILESMDDEQILFALRHELTHYRRKDHIVSLILRILEAIYWFNPIVWVASKRIQLDMETACDSDVVKNMGSVEKGSYAMTILEMFSQDKRPKFVLGMALSGTRQVAEERIRGIYKNGKMRGRTKLVVVMLIVAMLFSCFTTACQPTPEEHIVKGKSKGTFMDNLSDGGKINKADAGDRFKDYPKSWSDEIKVKPANISVDIDADIIIPVADKLPIYTIAFDKMGQEQVDGFLSMFGDVEYNLNTDIKTKSDYEKEILERQRDLAIDLQEIKDKDEREKYKKGLEDYIQRLKQDMQHAPETINDVIEPTFTNEYIIRLGSQPEYFADEEIEEIEYDEGMTAKAVYERSNTEAIDVKWKLDSDNMTLWAYRSDNTTYNVLEFSAGRHGIASSSLMENISDIDGFDTRYDEAKALAENAVSSLGADYLSVSHSAKGVSYTDYDKLKNDDEYIDFSKLEYTDRYYVFYFTRDIDGISDTYCTNGQIVNDRHDEPWPYERLSVEVDDKGIRALKWESGGTKLGNQLSDDVELLPFEEIGKIAAEQLSIGNIAFYDKKELYEDLENMNLYIDKIVLGYMRIKLSDGSDRYVTVPVWDFFGNYEGTILSQDKDTKYEERYNIYSSVYGIDYRHSYLTINAIDGSVIDRSLGY